MRWKDVGGAEIDVGDLIVYSVARSTARMKFGVVTSLGKHDAGYVQGNRVKVPHVMAVTAHRSWRGWCLQNGGRPLRITRLDRVLVVFDESFPSEALELLGEKAGDPDDTETWGLGHQGGRGDTGGSYDPTKGGQGGRGDTW